MEATVVDLRYHMNDVLKALDRNEEIRILYRGKLKGVICSAGKKTGGKVKDHPFFGMETGAAESVEAAMKRLRGGRCRAL